MAQSNVESAIQWLTSRKWQIVYRNESGVQLKKSKEWSTWFIILFVAIPLLASLLFLPALGVALFCLLLAVVDYITRTDQTLYLTTDQLQQLAEGKLRIKGEH